MLQLRGRQLPASELYQLAVTLRPHCHYYGVTFIVNDRLDVGLAVQADGFQLGRHSLPLPVARQFVGPSRLLGASVHSLQDAHVAIAGGADFLVAGTIFASPSHPGEVTNGTALLSAIKKAYPNCPLLAIGGITTETASQTIAAGADGIAVISAILRAADVACAVRDLRTAIGPVEKKEEDAL
jgi:thiamine-phosphate pyrophosphorylase